MLRKRADARRGVASAVRGVAGRPGGAAALVYVVAGGADEEDEHALRAADRAHVPIVASRRARPHQGRRSRTCWPRTSSACQPGAGFPVDEIGRALAQAARRRATPLAARLPAIRRAVCDALIARYARQNALVGAAVFLPGVDMPVLTLNQIRLVLRIADAYGFEIDRERLPEVLGVIAGGLGLRALAPSAPSSSSRSSAGRSRAPSRTRARAQSARRRSATSSRRAPVTRVPGARARFP